MKVEICCGSYQDCLNAYHGGADRIELNSALFLGGLTPSIASLKLAKQEVEIPIVCMVRPRGAGFNYDENEIKVIFEDAKELLEAGADGLAFGFLNEDASIEVELTKKMVELIHSYGKEAVFHRAYDCVADADAAMETLIECKVDRVLTSGLKATAIAGGEMIAHLVEKYGDRIEILAGSGVKDHNVVDFVKATKVEQVHSSAKAWAIDKTTTGQEVTYAYHEPYDYDVVDLDLVKKIVHEIRGMED